MRHNKVAHYIVTQSIMDLCDESMRHPGMRVSKRWLEKEGLDMAGTRAAVEAETERLMEVAKGDAKIVAVNYGRIIKYQLSTNKGNNLVTIHPMFWVGNPPPNYEHAMGSQRPVSEI